MNVEIRTEAAQFPEKEYIKGIYVPVRTFTKVQITCNKFNIHPKQHS